MYNNSLLSLFVKLHMLRMLIAVLSFTVIN